MNSTTIQFEVPEPRLSSLVSELRASIKADCGTDYPESTIRNSVITWLDSRLDTLFEDAVERLTSPSYEDAREFARMLDDSVSERSSVVAMPRRIEEEVPDVFNGKRTFSPQKMAAMISHLANRTSDLYKTKLNKLLFYADFSSYYSFGQSISGSRYVHLPYGPVPEGYEGTLKGLESEDIIKISASGSSELVEPRRRNVNDALTDEEMGTLDWIAETYGFLSASQLTELSHRERAYRDTKTGEEIAYEYAKFLAKLPPKTT